MRRCDAHRLAGIHKEAFYHNRMSDLMCEWACPFRIHGSISSRGWISKCRTTEGRVHNNTLVRALRDVICSNWQFVMLCKRAMGGRARRYATFSNHFRCGSEPQNLSSSIFTPISVGSIYSQVIQSSNSSVSLADQLFVINRETEWHASPHHVS